jgi:hypothetical protein
MKVRQKVDASLAARLPPVRVCLFAGRSYRRPRPHTDAPILKKTATHPGLRSRVRGRRRHPSPLCRRRRPPSAVVDVPVLAATVDAPLLSGRPRSPSCAPHDADLAPPRLHDPKVPRRPSTLLNPHAPLSPQSPAVQTRTAAPPSPPQSPPPPSEIAAACPVPLSNHHADIHSLAPPFGVDITISHRIAAPTGHRALLAWRLGHPLERLGRREGAPAAIAAGGGATPRSIVRVAGSRCPHLIHLCSRCLSYTSKPAPSLMDAAAAAVFCAYSASTRRAYSA